MSFKGDLIKAGIGTDGKNVNVFNGTLAARNLLVPLGNVYYVDKGVTASGNGRSWLQAFKTIQEAVTQTNSDLDWSADPWLLDSWIFIAPGTYVEAITPPYSCHMVGLGHHGTDGVAEIAPGDGDGAAITGTGLGLELRNLRFEAYDAGPVLDFGICNNVIIDGCQFAPANAQVTHAISTENASHLQVKNCLFSSGLGTPGFSHILYAAGGADKYLFSSTIENNIMSGLVSGGTAIYIQSNCTATETFIVNNIIRVPGSGKGIDDNNGNTMCIGNHIAVGSGGDAIEHAGGNAYLIDNHVNVNGTGGIEVTSS